MAARKDRRPAPMAATICTTGELAALALMSRDVVAAVVLVDLLEVLLLRVLRGEHLDDAMSFDGFLGHAGDVAHGLLDARAVAPEPPVDAAHDPADHRRDDQDQQR